MVAHLDPRSILKQMHIMPQSPIGVMDAHIVCIGVVTAISTPEIRIVLYRHDHTRACGMNGCA